jgi:hypothetical protein
VLAGTFSGLERAYHAAWNVTTILANKIEFLQCSAETPHIADNRKLPDAAETFEKDVLMAAAPGCSGYAADATAYAKIAMRPNPIFIVIKPDT